MKRVFCAMFSFLILFSGIMAMPLTVLADTVVRPNAPSGLKSEDIEGVYQSAEGEGKHFINAAPLVAIYIDEDKIDTDEARKNAKVEKLYENNTHPRARYLKVDKVSTDPAYNYGANGGEKFLVFDQNSSGPGVNPDYKLKRDQDNNIPGKLIRFTFEGAAEYNGRPADVAFTYSNLNIVLQKSTTGTDGLNDDNYSKLDRFSIVGGNKFQIASTQKDPNTNVVKRAVGGDTKEGNTVIEPAQNQHYGFSIDVNVQVLQDGVPVNGYFYFRMVDIDVFRNSTSGNYFRLHNGAQNNGYSEQVLLRDGFKTSPYNGSNPSYTGKNYSIYIPGGEYDTGNDSKVRGYKCSINNSSGTAAGPYLFGPIVNGGIELKDKDPGTFYSGFMVVADNSTGINLTYWGAGCGNQPIQTVLLAGFRNNANIVHTIKSSTGEGGTIKTTTNTNASGKLDDGGDEIGPGSLMVNSGREITYTMIPDDPRCYPTSVLVDGTEVLTSSDVTNTTDSNGNPIWFYKFPGLTADHTIHVNWWHPPHTEQYVYSDNSMLPDEVKKTLPSRTIWYQNGEDATALKPGQKKTSDTPLYEVIVGTTRYTFKGWDQNKKTVQGANVQFVGSWIVTSTSDPAPVVNYGDPVSGTTPDPVTPAPAPAATPTSTGGGSTPPPATPVPEDALPALQVPSTETSGGATADGGTGLTIEQGQASPLAITPVLPEGVVAGGFRRVEVNGVVQPAELYHVNGDTVTLFPALLNTLPVGTHTIRLVYDNLWTEAVATVLGATRARVMNSPPTGDGNTALIYALIGIQAASAGGIALLLKRRRRS